MKPEDWDGNAIMFEGFKVWQTTDDMMNYDYFAKQFLPKDIVEIGPGEMGVVNFLKVKGFNVISVDETDRGRIPKVKDAMIILDGDVYNKDSVLLDLEQYAHRAKQLVICHTIREDWGSYKALSEWNHDEFYDFTPPHPTRHTWLVRK